MRFDNCNKFRVDCNVIQNQKNFFQRYCCQSMQKYSIKSKDALILFMGFFTKRKYFRFDGTRLPMSGQSVVNLELWHDLNLQYLCINGNNTPGKTCKWDMF